MIYKVLTRSTPSYNGLINYILNESKIPDKHIFTHNLRSKPHDLNGLAKEFIENESYRKFNRSDQIFLNHEIISFSALDSSKITPEVLSDIMEKYVSLRGLNGVYLAAIHQDTEHIHLHIAVSGLSYRSGKSFYLPKDKMRDLKKELQEYQKEKYPELKNSLPKHGNHKDYLTDREWQAKNKEGRNSIKERISGIVEAAYQKSQTQKEFLEILAKDNLHYYERAGTPTGILVDDIKIRFSRLGISNEQLKKLPMDLTAEKIAFNQIQQIRQERELNRPLNIKPKESEERIKENEEVDRINRAQLAVVREKKDDILATFGDRLIGSELALKLELELENLETYERELVRQIEGTTEKFEIVPFDDGAIGPNRVLHTIENGIEKTITFNETMLEKTWVDENGVQYSNESYIEPELRDDLDRKYEIVEEYENGKIIETNDIKSNDEDLALHNFESFTAENKSTEINDVNNTAIEEAEDKDALEKDDILGEINEIREEENEIEDNIDL